MKKIQKKKYTPKYFKQSLPEWKRKKDPILSRIFYRPISFYCASFATKLGLSANTISYFSIIIALVSCALFIIPNHICNIIAAILVNVWLISDCTDGNLARSVKKQPFGEFADGISSYIFVGLLCTCLGINAFFNGGILLQKGIVWIALLGALASSADTLMRLIYQKYKSEERILIDNKYISETKDNRKDKTKVNSLSVRIESDLGIGGILPLMVLLGTIFNLIDLVVIYCFLYYFMSSIVMILIYIKKACTITKKIEDKYYEKQ